MRNSFEDKIENIDRKTNLRPPSTYEGGILIFCFLCPFLLMQFPSALALPGLPSIGPYRQYEALMGTPVRYFQYFVLIQTIYSAISFANFRRFYEFRFQGVLNNDKYKNRSVADVKYSISSMSLAFCLLTVIFPQIAAPSAKGVAATSPMFLLALGHLCLIFAVTSFKYFVAVLLIDEARFTRP